MSLHAKVRPSDEDVKVPEDCDKILTSSKKVTSRYAICLHTMIEKYGEQRYPHVDNFETLRKQDNLVEWENIPLGSTKIYISHEWTSSSHPDRDGTHTYHLLQVIKRLQTKKIDRVDMDTFHVLLYKHKYTTISSEWSEILNPETTYLWYDICCCPGYHDTFQNTFDCVSACDFTIILVPGCKHYDRINPQTKRKQHMCYRTYRLRARCVLEMFGAFLTTKGGRRAKPMLLVRNGSGTPNWISPLECQKLKVGMSTFRCCETNHARSETCSRINAEKCLGNMIDTRAESLFEVGRYEEARMTICLKQWWLRGFENHIKTRVKYTSETFKKDELRYYSPLDGEWFDRCDYPILLYAVLSNRTVVVKELLESISRFDDPMKRKKYLCSRIPDKGLSCLGFTGRTTALHCAMSGASWEVVTLLLEFGADPNETDIAGNDPFMFGNIFGRADNVKRWLKHFPTWDLNRKNRVVGAVALGQAVYVVMKVYLSLSLSSYPIHSHTTNV